jgi:ABC-2 type transport system permease protein
MSSKITDRPEGRPAADGWGPAADGAPSVLREDELSWPRTAGLIGGCFVLLGGGVLILRQYGLAQRVNPTVATLGLVAGIAAMLYHAAFDRDIQLRRLYLVFSAVLLGVGAFLCVLITADTGRGPLLFGGGYVFMALALLFGLASHRNETDPEVRRYTELALAAAGVLLALPGLLGGNVSATVLLPYGTLLALLGAVYLAAFFATRGSADDSAYRAGWAVGAVGLLVFLVALGRSALPPLFHHFHWTDHPPADYLMPQGILLMILGLLYLAVAYTSVAENALVAVTRRELAAFFYSPIAYFVLVGFTLAAAINFASFVNLLIQVRSPIPEPVVQFYIYSLWPVITVVFAVPALTMRLLSEEQRSGTLEVLLTAPVGETTVVLGKFLAAFIMFLAVWVPFGLFLLALRLGGAAPFDYRPLLAFLLALCVTGAGLVSMGLFFSALTRNQIASGVLTFVGMFALLFAHIAKGQFFRDEPNSLWVPVLTHVSYLDDWSTALEGKIEPNLLLFYLSMAALFLFATVKVLESRKWR